MPRFKQAPDGSTKVWLSSKDTREWARRPSSYWPCSTLADRRAFAEYDSHGDLIDYAVDGETGEHVCDGVEFNAIMSDFLFGKFGADHPAIFGRTET
jgi:hypothetical protein